MIKESPYAVYITKYRPIGYATVPEGYVKVDREDTRGPFGVVYYDRMLTDKEVYDFELNLIYSPIRWYTVYGVRLGNQLEKLGTYNGSSNSVIRWAQHNAELSGKGKDFVGYHAEFANESEN